MDEKLKSLLEEIEDFFLGGDFETEPVAKEEFAKEIQQYSDEQALGFAKWARERHDCGDNGWFPFRGEGPITDQELLTRYHKSQKP